AKPTVVGVESQIRLLTWNPTKSVIATVEVIYEVVEYADGSGGTVISHSAVKLRDGVTGELKRTLVEEKSSLIHAIAFSPDGKLLAMSAAEQPADPIARPVQVRNVILDVENGTLKHRVNGRGLAHAFAFSPDGSRLALGGSNRHAPYGLFVMLWDVRNQK